jgi:hypothetical protein
MYFDRKYGKKGQNYPWWSYKIIYNHIIEFLLSINFFHGTYIAERIVIVSQTASQKRLFC